MRMGWRIAGCEDGLGDLRMWRGAEWEVVVELGLVLGLRWTDSVTVGDELELAGLMDEGPSSNSVLMRLSSVLVGQGPGYRGSARRHCCCSYLLLCRM